MYFGHIPLLTFRSIFLGTAITAAVSFVAAAGPVTEPAVAKSYDIGVDHASQFNDAEIVVHPSPVIPPELNEQCFKSCCIARFQIAADGKFKVKLLSSSGNNEIDDITLSTLKRWKFRPAILDGQPVSSTRRLKVEFEID